MSANLPHPLPRPILMILFYLFPVITQASASGVKSDGVFIPVMRPEDLPKGTKEPYIFFKPPPTEITSDLVY